MTTTAIFAEILIVGLETAAWILALILAISGPDELRLADFKGWEALATVVLIGMADVLGVVVDRIADDLRYWVDRKWPGRPVDRPTGITTMRLVVLRKGGDLSGFLIYQRSRLRLARATVLNLIVSIPVVLFFLWSWKEFRWPPLAAPVILAALAIATFIAYSHLEFAYISWLSEAYRLLEKTKDVIDIAAAVPYCVEDRALKFLLVRTKGEGHTKGNYWTFPKGHRKRRQACRHWFWRHEKDETLPEAAKREAEEEAGITGRIDPQRLMEFPYPNRTDPSSPDCVAAYLLELDNCEDPKGGEGREACWVSPDEARAMLASGNREAEYVKGLHEVVKRAERTIAAEHN